MSSKSQQYTGRLYTQAEVDRLVREARKQGALDVITQFKADRINHTLSTAAADWERELETADKTLERYIAELSKEEV